MSTKNPKFSKHWLPCVTILAAMLLLGLIIGCDGSDETTGPEAVPVSGKLVAQSDCGGYPADSTLADLPYNQTGVIWVYDGQGTLDLQHNNAAFNCCPQFKCEITVTGNTITIREKEIGMCHCLCLFDVDYQVIGLTAGTYNVKFVELHLAKGDEKLEFPITLGSSPASDTVTVNRDHYPWIPLGKPTGTVFAYSECGGFDSSRYAPDPSPDSNCIVYQYDVSNTLTITHQNATFNCCAEEPLADISVNDNVINIVESELAPNPCFCVCPFDLVMVVTNVLPGEYVITITSPYLSEAIRIEVDLINEPSGYICADTTVPN